MHRTAQKIATDLEELTRQLNSYKPANEGELGRIKGDITAELAKRLSVTEQKVTQLTGELKKQTKSVADHLGLLRDLMVGIKNLGENMKIVKV